MPAALLRQDNLPVSRHCQVFSGGKIAWLNQARLDKEGHKPDAWETRNEGKAVARAPTVKWFTERDACHECGSDVTLPNFRTEFVINGPGQGFSAIKDGGGRGGDHRFSVLIFKTKREPRS